ncbi:MAG: ribonuclease PH [Chloroflexi bacterium]|nr:ribonuclease PH [Chloroflexota bacterium]
MTLVRLDGRRSDESRPVRIVPGFQPYAEGSALIEVGNTRVVCAASVAELVPSWRRGSGQGWITAEYGMLPRSTHTRTAREAREGRQSGRTLEIQRLIGRSLRAVADLSALGERMVTLDCDVLQADGGTRTAAVTGAYVALYQACRKLQSERKLVEFPVRDSVAAISVGYVDGELLLDLAYNEDSRAQSDFNVVVTGSGRFVEFQGTAEGTPFDRAQLAEVMQLAEKGLAAMFTAQRAAMKETEK